LLVLDAAEGIAGVEREGAGTKRVEVDSAGIESQIEVVGNGIAVNEVLEEVIDDDNVVEAEVVVDNGFASKRLDGTQRQLSEDTQMRSRGVWRSGRIDARAQLDSAYPSACRTQFWSVVKRHQIQPRHCLPYLSSTSLSHSLLNANSFVKHITPTSDQRVKIGRQTNARTVPAQNNAYFDSKVLSRQHAEVWEENAKVSAGQG
jgi:hypothetical protein